MLEKDNDNISEEIDSINNKDSDDNDTIHNINNNDIKKYLKRLMKIHTLI